MSTRQQAHHRTDRVLIERCLDGDQTAWRDLVKQYERLVYSVAHLLCLRPEDASDVFQQVWLELYRHLGDLRNVEALPAWLITVTRRRAHSTIRARRNTDQSLDETIPQISEQIASIERKHTVESAINRLPERCRHLIQLLYFDVDEPTYFQIAEAMRMPQSSIGPTRARCLEKLRKLVG